MTDLYRHFDASGQLLYVGIADCALSRLADHAKRTWASEISRIEIEKFPDRDAAKIAEQRAIISEMPLHNVLGSTREYPMSLDVKRHPELLRLRQYLKSMRSEQRSEFAARAGTKVSYLNMAISSGKKMSVHLAVRLTRESGGAFNACRLFPHLGLSDHSQAPALS